MLTKNEMNAILLGVGYKTIPDTATGNMDMMLFVNGLIEHLSHSSAFLLRNNDKPTETEELRAMLDFQLFENESLKSQLESLTDDDGNTFDDLHKQIDEYFSAFNKIDHNLTAICSVVDEVTNNF